MNLARACAEDITAGFDDDGMDAKKLEHRLRHELGDRDCEAIVTPARFRHWNGQGIDQHLTHRKHESEREG